MEEGGAPLIRNRSSALLVALATGYLAVLEVRAALLRSPYSSSWPLDPHPLRWPNWVVVAANVVFYLSVVYALISLYRSAKDKERAVVLCFSAGFLILPLKILIAPHAITLIRTFQSICSGTAFLAALAIFVESPAWGKSDAAIAKQLAMYVGVLVIFALVIGALIYFLY